MSTPEYTMHVLSNTHWDREWLKTFQENRMALIDCLEATMDLLENDPDYRHFHLDSQTVPLEDCFAVRPDLRPRLEKHIKAGRLLVGPWYTLPEMNLIEGESIVRNLLLGHAVARDWGRVMKVGYNPMSNGQVSQLPQIYAGFEIDTILFYRGINRDSADVEFWWDAPDGSRALAYQFPDGRGVYWAFAYLPVAYGIWPYAPDTWKWHWGEAGLPFRIDDDPKYTAIAPTAKYRPENAGKALQTTREMAVLDTNTRHILYPEGHDQCPPYPMVPELIRDANRLFPNDKMVHAALPDAVAALKRDKGLKNLKAMTGEMRITNKSGRYGFCMLHPGILSTRLYLKQANRRSENKLFRVAEPLASMAWALGAEYPRPFFDTAVRLLMANHAHDDICGCSIDKVHQDMLYRNSEIDTLSDEISRRSLHTIVKQIDMSGPDDALVVTVINSLPYDRDEVMPLVIDVPDSFGWHGIVLRDSDGNEVPCQIENKRRHQTSVEQDAITRGFAADRYTVQAAVSVPALGYQVYTVAAAGAPGKTAPIARRQDLLENEHLSVTIRANGTLDVLDKASGQHYRGLHCFEDRGACGNAWVIRRPDRDRVVSSRKAKAAIRLLTNGPLAAKVLVRVKLALPKSATADFNGRAKETRTVTIDTVVALRRNAKQVEFETSFDNVVRSHRLRVLFPTEVDTGHSFGEMPFDVVKRKIALPADADEWTDRPAPEFPQINFCAVHSRERGAAVINRGMTDYEVVDDKSRTIALTLVRAISQGSLWSPDKWPDDGFQCQGVQTLHYAFRPFSGSWAAADLSLAGLCFNVPLRSAQCGSHPGKLPPRLSMLRVAPSRLVIHAVKQSRDGKRLVLRLSNPTTRAVSGTIECFRRIRRAARLNLEETVQQILEPDGNVLKLKVPKKKIVTLSLKLSQR